MSTLHQTCNQNMNDSCLDIKMTEFPFVSQLPWKSKIILRRYGKVCGKTNGCIKKNSEKKLVQFKAFTFYYLSNLSKLHLISNVLLKTDIMS